MRGGVGPAGSCRVPDTGRAGRGCRPAGPEGCAEAQGGAGCRTVLSPHHSVAVAASHKPARGPYPWSVPLGQADSLFLVRSRLSLEIPRGPREPLAELRTVVTLSPLSP